ncbi:MAG: CPBP family intramembrane metalloprotease [Oscillospiraceae bacterium]|nr:CPBP family intramembrane metalloprotease [Oscillospiraceae bacterium]MBR2421311.1 CPBP family intramembrane metalloprotease [Oscillospiraceae bacterium]
MKHKKQSVYVMVSVLLCTILMSVVDGIIQPGYAVKSAVKIVVFYLIPQIYFLWNREERPYIKQMFQPDKRGLKRAAVLGAGVYAVIVSGYFLLRDVIDFSGIAGQLTADAGVHAGNFLFVALYISLMNSLLEEFFFRGYAFLTLKRLTSRRFAYLFSSILFAAYHLGMTAGWFAPGVWLLSMAGLFVGGCIFDYLNEKSDNLYASWLVHLCANAAINTVGCVLFEILPL